MTVHDRDAVVDTERSACLGNGFHAALCVQADGVSWPWLVARHGAARNDDPHGCCCPSCAPHEQDDPLPDWMLEALTVPRCGRPTAAGRPCRIEVHRPGAACHWHRRAER